MDLPTDEQLVEKYSQGDEESLKILIRRHLKPIYNFVIRSINGKEEAEDLTQEVFLKTWSNLKKFDRQKKFKTWIYAIARNAIIDYLRKKKPLTVSSAVNSEGETVDYSALVADGGLSALDKIKLKEETADLEKALLGLPAEERMLLLLYYGQNITFREIAEIRGEPLDTIKSRHRRSLIKLRSILHQNK